MDILPFSLCKREIKILEKSVLIMNGMLLAGTFSLTL